MIAKEIKEPRVTSMLQVEFDGVRLTAHYVMANGKLEFSQITSNVPHVSVEMVTHIMLLDREMQRCTG
jgi:hypothetical protein